MTQPSKVALIVVDIQYDFLETGTLPVPHASDIIPKAQQLISFIESRHGLVVATQVRWMVSLNSAPFITLTY